MAEDQPNLVLDVQVRVFLVEERKQVQVQEQVQTRVSLLKREWMVQKHPLELQEVVPWVASKEAEVSIQAQHRYLSLVLLPPRKREVVVLKVVEASEGGLASSRVCHHFASLLVWRRLVLPLPLLVLVSKRQKALMTEWEAQMQVPLKTLQELEVASLLPPLLLLMSEKTKMQEL